VNGTPEADELFSSEVASRLTGVTARQLQWWDEKGVLSPRVNGGYRRLYSPDQLVMLFVIQELRRKGFSLQQIRRLLKKLNAFAPLDPASFVLTDGDEVLVEAEYARMVAIWSDAGARWACVSLDLFGGDHDRRTGASEDF